MKKMSLLLWWGVSLFGLSAQESSFLQLPQVNSFSTAQRVITPSEFVYLEADTLKLKDELWSAPSELIVSVNDSEQLIYLPDPDGELVGFQIVSYDLLKPASASQYPGIKTFYGREIGKGPRRIRLGWTYRGFHATIDGDRKGSWYIDPYTRQDKLHYQSYRKQALTPPAGGFSCGVAEGLQLEEELAPRLTDTRKIGDCQFRLYDLVISTTGEYYQYVGGNDTDVIAEITTAVNRVNSVVERDLSLRLQLIIDTDLLFSDGTSDPYDDSDGLQIIGVSTGVMDAEVGNYDIGHVFSTGGGGVAYRPSVCIDDYKGGGVTGLPNPTGDVFYIDYVAHEMGHQFGASHTFNAIASRSCVVETISTGTAFEPGSGSTIMAYAGICEPQNLQSNSDDYFHVGSLIEIAAYMKNGFGASCATIDPVLSNTAPTVNAGVDYIIPANTPFVLTASGNDTDGHSLSYTWEQYDAGGGAPTPPNGTETDDPLFRSWPPTTSPERYFPDYFDYLDNDPDPYEVLPSVGRVMTFKVTARDGAAGFGCPTEDEMTVTTVASSGFALISPNGGESWRAGTTNEVAWDVAGSNTNGIDIATVDIELSLDGGSTYPYLLASGTANDGSFMATLPDVESPSARIRIVPTNSIFYAVSANGFSMERNTFTLDGDLTRISCGGTNTLTVPFNVNSVQGYVGTVSLGIVGAAPAGTTATLNPVSVSLTADETELVNLELGGLSNLASGTSYFYTIEGTDGTETKQITIEVFRGGERSELVAPADGAVVDRTQPVFFDWEPVTEADGYRWQMYVGNLVYFFNTSATSVNLTLSSNIPDGTYDWEVVAISSSCNTEVASLRRAVTLSSGFLPVSWISFTAQTKENEVQLDWKVEQTAEHLGFELERSLDSRQFEKLSWVGAQGEPGPMAYRCTDATVTSGKTYYYRLRQLDQDGTSSYSRIVKVVLNQGAEVEILSLYPNPVGETLFVTADEQYWNRPYRILAVTGQFVQQGILRAELDVSPLAPGLYFLELPESGHSVRFLRK